MQLTSTHLRITLVYTVCAGRHAHCVHAHTHVYSAHPAVRYLQHSLYLLSLINPNMRQPEHHPSCAATLHQSPAKQLHAQEPPARKREVERRRRRRSGTEQGSRRWRAGERGFFGKGANPITGSGAAPVSLATLNSHFNGLFLRLLIPFPSIFVPLPDAFSPFCYRARHSRTLSKCAS